MPDHRDSDNERREPKFDRKEGRPQNDPEGGPPKPPNMGRGFFSWMMVIGVLILFLFLMTYQSNQGTEITPTEFVNLAKMKAFENDEVIVEDERIRGKLRPETGGVPVDVKADYKRFAIISGDTKALWVSELKDHVRIKENPGSGIMLHILISWGPFILVAFVIYFFFFRSIRNAGGGMGMLNSFGRSRHKITNKEHSTITLNDVAGIEEAKDEVVEIVEFLKNPKRFQRLGGRVPRGVLLIGQPGCGKTLLAKAVAGEAEVPFFSISGSDFVEMFVGVGASRVRDLFKQAKESSPCIIFLDEIDAVGRRRGSGFSTGGHDEREQTLNAILVEMDGFDTNDQVIVMAATNRADVLDPALTRPGRFDRQIIVPLPDIRGRLDILKVHSRRVKMGPDVDLEKLARGTPMFSGADLSAIINEAAISATLQNKDFVEHEDLEEARDKVRWGRARKSQKVEEEEKKVTAYHEAGHAILTWFDPDAEPLHKVTIIPRGRSLGATYLLPNKDSYMRSKKQLLADLRVSYGGRIAEEMFCGSQYTGVAGDIRQVSSIARAMIMEHGMSEKLGFLLYGHDNSMNSWEQPERHYSEDTARAIDEEVKSLVDRTYAEASKILEDHRQQVDAVAQALLRYETLSFDEVDKLMRGERLVKPTVSDLLEAEKKKTTPTPPSTRDDGRDDAAPGVVPSPA